MTGAEILVKCLEKQAVKVIFGMPGSLTREIYSALYKSRDAIRHISVRHEGSASLMADGYARVTGDVGVCLTVPGPGATNAYTGMLEGYTACTPVLLITAQNHSCYSQKDPSKMVHGLDQITAFRPVTKCIRRVEAVEGIAEAVYDIFGVLRSGRPKPVLLEITRDALAGNANQEIPDRNDGIKLKPTDAQIRQATDMLKKSMRPFILAGGGTYHSHASYELLEFAKLIKSPVATTAMGKGIISESEPLSLGYIGSQVARNAMQESDLVIAIGTRFVQTDTDSWSLKILQPLIHIEADPNEINKEYMADVGIAGDAQLVLKEIIKVLKEQNLATCWGSKMDEFKMAIKSARRPRYLQQLREAMAQDAILSVDVHMAGYGALPYFEVYEPGSFLHSPISNTMGCALPAAIGAKVAYPNRQVVTFCGDGGFMLSSPELSTAMRYNINVVIVVINDNSFGTIKDVQHRHFGRAFGVDLYNPDFLKFAEAFGAHGFRVREFDEFKQTLEKALTLDKPVLI
ncbi:MAG: thiamine pyrophosphate-binding protein, partial [Candidatus Hodarchaeota archaeon]